MEILIFIAFVVIVFLLVNLRSKQKEIADNNLRSFQSLKKELLQIKEIVFSEPKKDAKVEATDESVVQWRPYKAPEMIETPPPAVEQAPIIPTPEPIAPEPNPAFVQISQEEPETVRPNAPMEEKKSFLENWIYNNPDLEKFVGENLINKIGITVLVLGIAFFVKYAIDQNWISEIGRVSIGIGCGIILIGIAHYLRNGFRSFSSVLCGGGIAVFYFTIAFAYHEYQLFSQTSAFVIMVFITAFAVALSLLYNKIELAIISVIGGFIAPFLVSNGSGNYMVLFSYLTILNIGILSISYFKKWTALLGLAFLFTWIIFGGWLIKLYTMAQPAIPYRDAMLFATVFYILFLSSSLINNLKLKLPFKGYDFSLLLFITFSYYAQGMVISSDWNNGSYQGIFTVALGMINLCLAWFLFKTQKGDRNLLYLLIGLTLTFVSLAAPVQLHGHTITMFWSAESVLLYWLYQRSNITLFKYSSSLLVLMMFISLMMDWSIANESNQNYLPVIFTNLKGIVTNAISVLSLMGYAYLLRKSMENDEYVLGIRNSSGALVLGVVAASILYVSLMFGVNLYFIHVVSLDIPNTYHQLVTYLFVMALLFAIKKISKTGNTTVYITLILSCFALYLFSSGITSNLIDGAIENKYNNLHVIMQGLSAGALLFLLWQLIQIFRQHHSKLGNGFAWVTSLVFLLFISIQFKYAYIYLLANGETLSHYTTQYLNAGLTILWALFSFVIMWLGMKNKYKTLRIISLSIFSAGLLKLFILDIRNISEGGKITAFIMLGVLLLVISFMYQRLKKIIIANEEKSS